MIMLDPKNVKVKDFDGNDYQYLITQMPAEKARELINISSDSGFDVLYSVMKYVFIDGECLDTEKKINSFIPDHIALMELEDKVFMHTFGFLVNWKGIDNLPNINVDFNSIDCAVVDPIVAVILEEKMATLHELRTIYTLVDMMNMWAVINTNRANSYLAQKEAENRSKQHGR